MKFHTIFGEILDQLRENWKPIFAGYVLRQRPINPFHEPTFEGKMDRLRLEYTKEFVCDHGIFGNIGKRILDIGQSNPIGREIANCFSNSTYNYTEGNLNSFEWYPSRFEETASVVFCFEMIEHLLNPLLFFETLKRHITQDAQIFISYPSRMHFFWTANHFHEYDSVRFRYLVETAGYEIVAQEKSRRIWREWWRYLPIFGVRPFLRLFFETRTNFYLLRKEKNET